MNRDEYLKMLEDRIDDCTSNMNIAYRNYLAEKSKLEAALATKEMYTNLVKEGSENDRRAL
jgi:hypothetical protein